MTTYNSDYCIRLTRKDVKRLRRLDKRQTRKDWFFLYRTYYGMSAVKAYIAACKQNGFVLGDMM